MERCCQTKQNISVVAAPLRKGGMVNNALAMVNTMASFAVRFHHHHHHHAHLCTLRRTP